MNIFLYVSIFLSTTFFSTIPGILHTLQEQFTAPANFFSGITEEKEKQLQELINAIKKRKEKEPSFTKKITSSIEQLQLQINRIKEQIKTAPNTEYLLNQQTIVKETEQVLKDTLRAWNDLNTLMTEYQKELEKFIQDPDFSTFIKESKMQERLYYSFEDLQKLHELIQTQERIVGEAIDIEKNAIIERETHKRNVTASEKKYTARQEELKKQQSKVTGITHETKNIQDYAERELQLIKAKKTLEKLRFTYAEYEVKIASHKLFVFQEQLRLLKKQVQNIRLAIRVSQADIIQDKERLVKEKNQYFSIKDDLLQKRELIVQQKNQELSALTKLSKTYNIELGRALDEWIKVPQKSVQGYKQFLEIGLRNSFVLFLEKQRQFYDAEIELAKEKFEKYSLQVSAKETYNVITNRQFTSEDQITAEKEKFATIKSDAKASIALYKEKINAAANALNTQKKVIDNITALQQEIIAEKDNLFIQNEKTYTDINAILEKVEEREKSYVDLLGKLTGIYSGIITELDSNIRLADFIIGELQASTIWYRPAYAISWQGLENFIPDSVYFLKDISSYITTFNVIHFFARLIDLTRRPLALFLSLFYIFLVVLVGLFIYIYGISISNFLLDKSQQVRGLLRIISFLSGIGITFIYQNIIGIVIWTALGFICAIFPDTNIYILYYLFSIPYLLYLTYSFISLLLDYNVKRGYALLPLEYQHRFNIVISILLYITIVIFFFRQAFLLSGYYLRSELPNILLAVNFIVFQLSLIFLITKEQILSIIPEQTKFWRSIRERVNYYYYPILLLVITIIIMSNPYVGYGSLVLYVLSSVIYTFLLFKGLMWGQALLKNAVSFTFFETNNGIVRERFANAKTLFGLVIIASFMIAIFLGVLIGAKIWGWPVNINETIVWLNKPFMLKGTENPITTLSLLQIIGFILFGFTFSYILERFVLSKIFDLLFVEAGVQHTITRIAQYIIIIAALFLGFQNVGLGQLIGYIFGAFALSVGWYIKDPISDFFAYFIILVQRPINIGDYIFIDDATQGVVRKITARSVVLRQRNSIMIIVPNSQIVSRSIHNWNYVRSFVAFDDIMITVSYNEHPNKVRELLLAVLDAHPRILKNPKPIVRLHDFVDHGYRFLVRGFASSSYTLDMWDIASEIRLEIVQMFHKNNIDIAVPIRIYAQKQSIKSNANSDTAAETEPIIKK